MQYTGKIVATLQRATEAAVLHNRSYFSLAAHQRTQAPKLPHLLEGGLEEHLLETGGGLEEQAQRN